MSVSCAVCHVPIPCPSLGVVRVVVWACSALVCMRRVLLLPGFGGLLLVWFGPVYAAGELRRWAFCLRGFGFCFYRAPLGPMLAGQVDGRQERIGRAAGPVPWGRMFSMFLWVCGCAVGVCVACVSYASHVEGE